MPSATAPEAASSRWFPISKHLTYFPVHFFFISILPYSFYFRKKNSAVLKTTPTHAKRNAGLHHLAFLRHCLRYQCRRIFRAGIPTVNLMQRAAPPRMKVGVCCGCTQAARACGLAHSCLCAVFARQDTGLSQ